MNVQDALGITAATIEQNTENLGRLQEIKQFCEEAEATLAEHLGADNESVGQLGAASEQAGQVTAIVAQVQVELEHLQEILVSIR